MWFKEPLALTTPTPPADPVRRQAFLYLQASILGTLANFVLRFPLAEMVGFEASVILSNYIGMVLVFLLSYRRAFGVNRPNWAMGLRFVLVAHVGLVTVWIMSVVCYAFIRFLLSWFNAEALLVDTTKTTAAAVSLLPHFAQPYASLVPRLLEGLCHGTGIVTGFFVNFIGHRQYSFAKMQDTSGNNPGTLFLARTFALLVPLAYIFLYAPLGMDTTDFGFFYGHPWRILQGEVPFRDFYYTKPPASLYWHAFWLWLTPEKLSVLGGKAGFLIEMLAASWLGALFLQRAFALPRLGLPVSLLATVGFVYGVHSFPPMPWHSADGVMFSAGALYAAIVGLPWLAGLLAATAVLTKQSFLFVPLAAALVALVAQQPERELPKKLHPHPWACFTVLLVTGATLTLVMLVFQHYAMWEPFKTMTTGGLSLSEALEAGIGIYFRQNLWIPALAFALWGLGLLVVRGYFQDHPWRIQLLPLYTIIVTVWYVYTALSTGEWIGYGASWPTLFMLLGALCVLLPKQFATRWQRVYVQQPLQTAPQTTCQTCHTWQTWLFKLRPSIMLGAALLVAWSAGISGGYKIPAFFSVPLLFAAMLVHVRLGGKAATLGWIALGCGLVMFRAGYEYPYVFPVRPMPRATLTLDAGTVFPRLTGVLVDKEMLGLLRDLQTLRLRYGPNYKTLPGFPLAFMLTNDKPGFSAEWLQDWEISYDTDKVYDELVSKDVVVFFERSQLNTLSPDGYARTRYTVPTKVRQQWRKIDETEHFVVFKRP